MENEKHELKRGLKKVTIVRFLKTLLLISTWIGMGMEISVRTSTLPDLRTRLNTTVEGLSYAFTFISTGAIVGSILTVVVDRLFSHSDIILGLVLFVSAATNVVMPLVVNIWIYAICLFFNKVCAVITNAAGTAVILSLWELKAGGALQAMHLGFPIGALLGGLLTMPFVSVNCENDIANSTCKNDIYVQHNKYLDNSSIEYAYGIVACYICIMAMLHIGMHFIKTDDVLHKKTNTKWKDLFKPSKWASGDSKFGVRIVIVLCLCYICKVASTNSIQQYITTYAVDSGLGFSNADAAALNSVLHGMGGLGRAVFVPLATHFAPITITMITIHGQLIAAVLCGTIGTRYNQALWASISMYAFFRDPLLPSLFAWGNHYIIILALIVGLMNIVASVGDIIMNILVGYLYTNTFIESIFYTCIGFSFLFCIVTYVMYFYTRNRSPRNLEKEDESSNADNKHKIEKVFNIQINSINSSDDEIDYNETETISTVSEVTHM